MTLRHLTAVALLVPALAACTSNSPSGDAKGDERTIAVTSTDDGCEVSTAEVPEGALTFKVKNAGTKVTEFYLLAAMTALVGLGLACRAGNPGRAPCRA